VPASVHLHCRLLIFAGPKRKLRNNIDVINYFADDNEMCEY